MPSNTATSTVDRFLTPVTPGDIITYPTRDGSATYAVDAVVIDASGGSFMVVPIQRTGIGRTYPLLQKQSYVRRIERATVLRGLRGHQNPTGLWVIEQTVPDTSF